MRLDLTGRTALVTGSTAGIGYAAAVGLASAGAEVVVNGRTPERVEAAVASVAERSGGVVRGCPADLSTAEGCASVISAEPDVDILVNNLGIADFGPMFSMDDESWQRHFDTNVMSGIRLTRHHAPRMVERGWGRVIFVSSESGVQMWPDMAPYGMTKAAQIAVARAAAAAVKGSDVTVNTVLAGPTITEASDPAIRQVMEEEGCSFDEAADRFIRRTRPMTLLGRMATGEEIANMIVYLASDQSRYTTGTAIRVDGGAVPTAL